MSNITSVNSMSDEKGSALIEFGIVFPIFILLFFAGYEFSNFLERWQQTTTYSRTAANNVFRDCAADRNDDSQEVAQRLTLCLAEQRTRILDEVSQLSPELEMVLSVYEYDEVSNRVNRIAIVGSSARHPSRYSVADFRSPGSTFGQAIRENEILVVGEAYSPTPILGLIDISVSFLDEAYASTIM